jgi:hypothetical protein
MLPRLKFQISALVKEMLDRIPASAFTSSTTTFLDPAMAGGQFIVEIIRKLRYNGHTDENIASRVYGLAEDIIDLNYARKVGKLIGKYSVGGIEQMEEWIKMGKKFDVVIGNPPYQDTEAAKGRKTATKPLWIDFSELGHKLVNDTGVVAYVTPSTWLSTGTASHKAFKDFPIAQGVVFTDSTPFPGVGTSVSYWISTKSTSDFTVSDEYGNNVAFDRSTNFFPCKTKNLTAALTIFNKTLHAIGNKLDVVVSMKFHNEKAHLFSDKDASFKYPVFHTNSATKWTNVFDAELMGVPKVIAAKTGSFAKALVDTASSVTNLGVAFRAPSLADAERLHTVLQSRLYRFLVESMRHSATIPTPVYKSLPAVDLTRSWTDAELYAHFNLTQEEIDLIEATVK